jgi:Glycosyltransferases involved in cell wall biogenesis
MKSNVSLLTITKNAQETLEKTLLSVEGLVDEVVIIDDYSTDRTLAIAKRYRAKIFLHHEKDFGKQKAYGLKKCQNKWILVLDSDEFLSPALKQEIALLFKTKKSDDYAGFLIPFQNHFLGRKVNYGGENYKKLIFFKKDAVEIRPALVHEKFEIKKGKIGELKNKVYHYSYRSLWQMFKKFTDYGLREAKQKLEKNEKITLKKLFLYAPHMFYARFIKDKGYKDGLFRIPLDLGFAYMEFLTYWWLLIFKLKRLFTFLSFFTLRIGGRV